MFEYLEALITQRRRLEKIPVWVAPEADEAVGSKRKRTTAAPSVPEIME